MNEFDSPQIRWAERAKYRYLIERLAGDEPLVPKSQPVRTTTAYHVPREPSHSVEHELEQVEAPEATEMSVGWIPVHREDRMPAVNVVSAPPAVPISAADVASLIEQGVEAAVRRAMARPGSEDLLSSRVSTFLDKKREQLGDNAKHLADYPGRIGIFLAIIGDKPIGSYSREDMRRFRDIVDQVPVKAKQRFRTDDPLLQIRLNSELAIPVPKIDPVTVDAKYLSPIKTLFSHFVGLGIIERSPIDGIASKRVKGEDGIEIDASEERLPFEPHHLAALRTIADRKPKNSPDYWWIRVLPRTGLRLDEFAVLSPLDVRQINGRWCIDLLHLDDGDPVHRERRRELDLKTASSRRVVPIHPAVIADGFLEFVEKRRSRDGDRCQLFPMCRPDKYGCYSSALSKRLARQIDNVTTDKRHVAHSTRHNFAEACDAASVPIPVREKFMGHALDEDGEKGRRRSSREKLRRRYGSPVPSAEEMAWIDTLKI
ncbi:tyrosine-type recombinase/integrase [Aurantimonas coralicida]|uniref:tyrosine-type recombinase/integrase n=1 Tax=Aurantimonas coralicida TaxID=182270 RepID=UPI001E44A50C|nr:tyrosine-type recombinase/integrase [Aurantimonas coralicida]MCD1645305.1 tyrosine-type recombinase/integrase [Aurantimonas coralicida]